MTHRPTCYIERRLPHGAYWCPDSDPTFIMETMREALAGCWVRTYPMGRVLTVMETMGPVHVVVQVDCN